MADLTSEAKVPLLPLNSTPKHMLLRHMPTRMLHVCNAIDRISCFFYSMAEIMALLKKIRQLEFVRGTRTFLKE